MAHLRCFPQGVVAFDIGPRLIGKPQSLRRIDGRGNDRFAVDQPVKQIQHMRLRRNTCFQCQLDGREHSLFVMLEDKCQDVGHLAIAARLSEKLLLQRFEGIREFDEGGNRCEARRVCAERQPDNAASHKPSGPAHHANDR